MQVAVSADGSFTMMSNGKTVSLEDMTRQLASTGAARMVEITVDPRASGAAVDAMLNRLRDAGVSRCTLVVDPAAASVSGPASSRTDFHKSLETSP